MAKKVPTSSNLKSAGMAGGVDGGTLALGEIVGRAVLGDGPGTALGGVLAAATESGDKRDTMAMIAIERAANELVGR